jgi:hypothetical protein
LAQLDQIEDQWSVHWQHTGSTVKEIAQPIIGIPVIVIRKRLTDCDDSVTAWYFLRVNRTQQKLGFGTCIPGDAQ